MKIIGECHLKRGIKKRPLTKYQIKSNEERVDKQRKYNQI